MSQENQGISPAAPQTLPMKRKRGRPRKDGQINVERLSATPRPDVEKVSATPRPDVMTRNQRRKVSPSMETENSMVGQVVSGVLDGSFDAGYLLTVRVGDTDTILRGVVFAPGLSVPVSGANDVAPHVKMLKRFDIPLSAVGSPTQVRGSTSQHEQKSELLQRDEGSLPTKVSTPVNPSVVTSKGIQVDAKPFPDSTTQAIEQAEYKNMNSGIQNPGGKSDDTNKAIQGSSQAEDSQDQKSQPPQVLQKDHTGLIPIGGIGDTNKGPVISSQQAVQSELQKEPSSSTQPLYVEHEKSVQQDLLPDIDPSSISGAQHHGDASKGLMLEPKTESSVRMSLDLFTQAEHQTVEPEIKQDQLIDVELKYHTAAVNKTPMDTAVQALATEEITESVKVLPEDQTSEEHRMHQSENSSRADEATKRDAHPNLSGHQPLGISEREAMPILPHGSGSDLQSVLPGDAPEHQTLNFTEPTRNKDISQDAVPRAQLQSNSSELNNTDSVTEPQ